MSAKKNAKTKREQPGQGSQRPITPEDLLRLQIVSDPCLAPGGSQILFTKKQAAAKPAEYDSALWLVAVAGGAPRQFTSGSKDRHGRWSADGSRVAFIGERQKRQPQIYTMPAGGGEAVPLTRFPEGSIREFKWSPDGRWLAAAFRATADEWTEAAENRRKEAGASTPPRVIEDMFYRLDGDGYFLAQRHALYLVDAATGEARMVFDEDTNGQFSFDWSPDSQRLAITANTSRQAILKPWKGEIFLLDVAGGKPQKVPDVPIGTKDNVQWSPDGRWLAFAGREGKQPIWGIANSQLYLCDPQTGATRSLTADADYCVAVSTLSDTRDAGYEANFVWSPDSSRIYLNLGWHGESQIASVPIAGGAITLHTAGARVIALGNVSRDGTKLALTDGHQLAPSEVCVGSWAAAQSAAEAAPEAVPAVSPQTELLTLTTLSDFNGKLLAELELSPVERHWIESADGTRVQVWSMPPLGFKEGRKYPAVLEIHGGPHTQYGEAFFHEFQLLAAAGYCVFFSNPRGSKGYGEAHCTAIKGKWGVADWQDIQAVTAFMRSQSYVAGKHMGVMGGSYGGYMTNWAISHCDDFIAAITDRCVSNLVSMVGSSDYPLVPGHYWDGNSWDHTENLWEQSPLKHFGNVKVPTLIIHSEGDLRCNVEQSEQVFAALKLRDIPTRFVRYPATTSHGLSRTGPPDLRLHRLGEILAWWKQHLE